MEPPLKTTAIQKIFTTGQVAKIMGCAPRTVSKIFDSGKLKGYRIPLSQDRRVPRDDLVQFLKDHNMPLGDLEREALCCVAFVGCPVQTATFVDQNLSPHDYICRCYGNMFDAAGGFHADAPNVAVLDLGGLGRKSVSDIISGCRQFKTRFVILAPDGTTADELTEYRDAGYAVVDELDSAALLEAILTEGAK